MRKPPAWFVRSLKALNPNFSVKWDGAQGLWAIQEAVRHSELVTVSGGTPVFRMHRRPETALRFAGLGSRLLDHVRKNDPRRYNSVAQMVKKLKIDERLAPAINQ